MKAYESDVEILTPEILANWRLSGVKAVLYEEDAGDALLSPLMNYDPDARYAGGWAVEITEREAFEAANGIDGMVFYVMKNKIVIEDVLS
jgi:hypothetical protein